MILLCFTDKPFSSSFVAFFLNFCYLRFPPFKRIVQLHPPWAGEQVNVVSSGGHNHSSNRDKVES